MSEPCISVVIPTYKRAHILERTIPTYLQPETLELIVVDDSSPDATIDIVRKLARADRRIRYLRSERNLKQPHAKNMGIGVAAAPYIYFGDDDSILLDGSLHFLLETMQERNADIVGARAPYMTDEDEGASVERRFSIECVEKIEASCWQSIIHPLTLQARFDRAFAEPVEVPFTQASFLAKKELAKTLWFDESYTGNCFREETDFLIRAKASGASIWYDSRAAQVNLPRSIAQGGAHDGSSYFLARKLRYFKYALQNNWKFLNKNRQALRKALGVSVAPGVRQCLFLAEIATIILSYPLRKVTGRDF